MEDSAIEEILREILVTNKSQDTRKTGFTDEERAFLDGIIAAVPRGAQCVFTALEQDGTLTFLTTGSTNAGAINVLALVIHRLAVKS
jgi:hypothetical protein